MDGMIELLSSFTKHNFYFFFTDLFFRDVPATETISSPYGVFVDFVLVRVTLKELNTWVCSMCYDGSR